MNKQDLRRYARHGIRVQLAQIEQILAELHEEFPEEFASPTPPVLLSPERKENGNDWPAFAATKLEDGNGNGHVDEAEELRRSRLADSWTPARRKAQAERMRGIRLRGSIQKGSVVDKVLRYLNKTGPGRPREVTEGIGLGTHSKKQAVVRSALKSLRQRKFVTMDKDGRYIARPQKATASDSPRVKLAQRNLGTASGVKMEFYEYLKSHGRSRLKDIAEALKRHPASLVSSAEHWIPADIIRRVDAGMYEVGPTPLPPPPEQ